MLSRSFFLSAILVLAAVNAQDDNNEEKMDDKEDNTVTIDTLSGPITGMKVEPEEDAEEGKTHYQFLGIPYAEAPEDGYRFRDPLPKKAWKDALNATVFGAMCPQLDGVTGEMKGEEDCLFLNVFTPRLPAQGGSRRPIQSSLLPVMVYIHGGTFNMGSGNMVPAGLVNKDVIVVTLNYRLGALGFLNLGNSLVSGNQGLKDQLEALRWVQANAGFFGGDSSKVTLFGSSAGATSAHLHQLSPLGNGLYRGVIAQSGSAFDLTPLIEQNTVVKDSNKLVDTVDCKDANPGEVLKCLQELEIEDLRLNETNSLDLFGQLRDLEAGNLTTFSFAPSMDSFSPRPFLPQNPLHALRSGAQKDIPSIVGFQENEGAFVVPLVFDGLDQLNENWTVVGPHLVFNAPLDEDIDPLQQLKANVSKHFYLGKDNFTADNVEAAAEMFSDLWFIAPTTQALNIQEKSQRSPIFVYLMTHKPSASFFDVIAAETGAEGLEFGATHGDENVFIFGDSSGVEGGIVTDEDKAAAEVFTMLWSNFAKHQDPTPYFDEDIPMWEAYTKEEPKYLDINAEPEMKEELAPERLYFWDKVIWKDRLKGQSTRPQQPIFRPPPPHIDPFPVPAQPAQHAQAPQPAQQAPAVSPYRFVASGQGQPANSAPASAIPAPALPNFPYKTYYSYSFQ